MQRVISRHNPRLRDAARLIASSRERRKQGRCVIEGEHLIGVYLDRYGAPEMLLVNEEVMERPSVRAIAAHNPARTLIVPSRLFADLAVLPADVGMLAVVSTPQPSVQAGADFCLLLEDVQDPGNVGSMLRSAAASGVDQVILSKHCAFAWSPKVLRAAQGAHFLLDIHHDVDLAAWAASYRKNGRVVASVTIGGASVYSTALSGRIAIAIGNEGAGVSSALLSQADMRVTIPMPGRMESLNAAAAAAVLLFECVRQRRSTEPA